MNFKELISKRRACKLFNDKKINEFVFLLSLCLNFIQF